MNRIKDNSPVTIIDGFLEFSYVENRGMVFGVLNDRTAGLKRYALTALTLLAMAIIISMIWRIRDLPFIYHLPFFMILAGAIGNLIDRLTLGFVVDFIHMHWRDKLDYPWLYNVADALIVVGLVILVFLFWIKKEKLENAFKKHAPADVDSNSIASNVRE